MFPKQLPPAGTEHRGITRQHTPEDVRKPSTKRAPEIRNALDAALFEKILINSGAVLRFV